MKLLVGILFGFVIGFLYGGGISIWDVEQRYHVLPADTNNLETLTGVRPTEILTSEILGNNIMGEGGYATFSFVADEFSEEALIEKGFVLTDKSKRTETNDVSMFFNAFEVFDRDYYKKKIGNHTMSLIAVDCDTTRTCVYLSCDYRAWKNVEDPPKL